MWEVSPGGTGERAGRRGISSPASAVMTRAAPGMLFLALRPIPNQRAPGACSRMAGKFSVCEAGASAWRSGRDTTVRFLPSPSFFLFFLCPLFPILKKILSANWSGVGRRRHQNRSLVLVKFLKYWHHIMNMDQFWINGCTVLLFKDEWPKAEKKTVLSKLKNSLFSKFGLSPQALEP